MPAYTFLDFISPCVVHSPGNIPLPPPMKIEKNPRWEGYLVFRGSERVPSAFTSVQRAINFTDMHACMNVPCRMMRVNTRVDRLVSLYSAKWALI